MRKKIADGGFETPYRLHKQIVEAVFGQINLEKAVGPRGLALLRQRHNREVR